MGLNFKSYIRITDNIFYTSFTKLIDCYVPFWYIADTNRGKKILAVLTKPMLAVTYIRFTIFYLN